MDKIEEKEVLKWLNKLENKLKKIKPKTKKGEDILKNTLAYRDDCRHWLKEKNLVLAFESIIWSWSWLEIALELGQLSED